MNSRVAEREKPVLTRCESPTQASRTGRIESCDEVVSGSAEERGSRIRSALAFVATARRLPSGDHATEETCCQQRAVSPRSATVDDKERTPLAGRSTFLSIEPVSRSQSRSAGCPWSSETMRRRFFAVGWCLSSLMRSILPSGYILISFLVLGALNKKRTCQRHDDLGVVRLESLLRDLKDADLRVIARDEHAARVERVELKVDDPGAADERRDQRREPSLRRERVDAEPTSSAGEREEEVEVVRLVVTRRETESEYRR